MTQVLSFANGTMKFGSGKKEGQRLTAEEALELLGESNDAPVDANGKEVDDENNGDPNKGAEDNTVKLALPEDFDSMTVTDLKAFATAHDIDLGENTLKDDIKAAIVAAVNAANAE